MISRPRSYVGRVVVPALSILLALLVASVLIIASGLIGPEKQVNFLLRTDQAWGAGENGCNPPGQQG